VASGPKVFTFRLTAGGASVNNVAISGHTTTSVLAAHNGELWVGVDDSLRVYSHGHFRTITFPDGSPFGPIRTLCCDRAGWIWALRASDTKPYRIGPDYIPREITKYDQDALEISDDPFSGVWVRSSKRLLMHFTSEGATVAQYEIPSRGNNHLFVERDSSLWLSQTKGLMVMTNGKWITMNRNNGLPCEEFYASIRDNQQSLWLYASCGIIRLPSEEVTAWRQDPKRKVGYELFDATDGAQTSPRIFAPAFAKTPDGRLWFVESDVLQMLDPGRIQHNLLPPPIKVEALLADHRNYPLSKTMRLQARTRDVQIDYTGLSFVAPQKVTFRYRLLGSENDWSDVTTRRQAFYMNLGPGTYTFQVQASNNDGVWNRSGDSITFVIPPTLIQTMWFRILLGAVILLMIVVAIVARMRHVSEAIRSQLSERMVERERIARELHDTLLQGFQGLILRFGTAARHIPKGEPSKAMMESALDRADEVLLEGRSRVRDLRAEDVTSSDLLTALSALSDELAIGQVAAFDVSMLGDERELHPIVREEAYWIGREALLNAQAHASATVIRLNLEFGPKAFVLTCADDGRGIEPDILEAGAREGHWGLSGMRERAAKIGGTVKIACDGGPGTRVTLRVPAAFAYRKTIDQSTFDRLKMLFR
jgi:signal transduction histidine kinase